MTRSGIASRTSRAGIVRSRRRIRRNIERFAQRDPLRARAAVRQALETHSIVLRPTEHGRHVVAEFGLVPVAVATGTVAENVVAGACFGNFRRLVEII
jgi:hypothetical protein